MARRLSLGLCLLLLASLAMAGEASGGNIVNFSAPTSTTLPPNPSSVAVDDFNADGDLDLAVANDASSNVSILTGGLGGTFSAPTNIAVAGGAAGITVGNVNFDQDKDPDLIVVGTGGTVTALLGSTGSMFSTGQTMTAGTFPVAVALGDFNGDTDPEIAVANQGGDNVSIFTADVLARFVPTAMNFSAGDAPNSIAIGNFDTDTDPDLAVTNQGQLSAPAADNVSILTGSTGATFAGPTNFPVGDFPQDVATADFNQDGDPDLAVANQGSGTGGPLTTTILTGTGTGATFATSSTLAGGGRAVRVGDFNSDGDADLAAGGASNNLSILAGAAGAAFGAAQNFALGGDGLSVGVGDWNQDLQPDVAGANYFAGSVTTALNTSDLIAPDTTITGGPSGPTNDSTPTFTFTSSEGGPGFQCSVDGAAFVGCSSPHTTAALGNGGHTLQVRAIDAGGNIDASPASRSFTVDTVAPDTTITVGPSGPTNDSTPTFTFSSPDTSATFQCRVDTGAFTACTSPHTTAALADGARTFEVRAIDAAGNVDATPASRGLTVDTAPPDTTINSGPSGPTNDTTPTFTFSSSEAGSTFECRVDTGTFTACTSPHTTAALADGAHTFEVRAVDALGNADPTAVSRSLTVDTTPPETTIVSGPSGEIDDNTPTFEFSSSEAGSTFQCKLDASPFLPCSSPFTLPALSPGSHTFQVRSIDRAGNVDASPSSTLGANAALRTFTVAAAAPGPPVLGKKFNVEPVKGDVFVSEAPGGAARASATVPGLKGRNFVPLQEARQVAVGSILDTRKGTVRLTSARSSKGVTQTGEFLGGVFQVLQSGKSSAKGLTQLRLKGASFARCRSSSRGRKASAARSRRKIRRLRGSGKGRFSTRGRYSAATVRGTIWTVTDRCDGTLTKVTRGRVAVRDLRKRKTIVLRAGKSYLARAPG